MEKTLLKAVLTANTITNTVTAESISRNSFCCFDIQSMKVKNKNNL